MAGALLRIGEAFTFARYRNLWTAAFTSAVGTWMQRFAQQWLIFDLTGSAFYLGLDMFLGALPLLLFTLIGGVVADRYDRRHLLMGSQALQMACALTLTGLVVLDAVQLPWILALSFLTGLAQAFGGPAFQSIVPALVPRRTLPNAIALNSIQHNLAQAVGPFLGGLVFTTLGLAACFGINSVSFLVVIVVLTLLQGVARPAVDGRRPMLVELGGGLSYVRHGESLLALTVLALATTTLGLPLRTFLPVFAVDADHLSRLMTAVGVGAVGGALVVAWLGTFRGMGRTLLVTLVAYGALVAAFALLPVTAFSYVLLCLGGGALLMAFSLTASLVQLAVPDELRGRVMSIYLMAFRGGMPLGSLAGGYVTTLLPVPTVIAANGILLMVVAAGFLLRRGGVREPRRSEPLRASTGPPCSILYSKDSYKHVPEKGTLKDKPTVADEAWIATALLHREHPEREDFSKKEIVRRAERIAGPEPLRPGVGHYVSYHAVAQKRPNPGRHCLLFATARGRRRLFRPGDPRHPDRRGNVVPQRSRLPAAYRSLIDWYHTVYAIRREDAPPDPVLALRGVGRALWADEEADAYVARLREGWS